MVNLASPNTDAIVFFRPWTSSVVLPPEMMSSTYRLLKISSTSTGYLSLKFSKCNLNVPANKNGDWTNPKSARVNLNTSIVEGSLFLIQWNRKTSLSSALMRTCRKACLMSAVKAIGLRRLRTSTFHNRFCRGGPVSKHSFNDGLSSLGLADASKTILSFVVVAVSLFTGLCGM